MALYIIIVLMCR